MIPKEQIIDYIKDRYEASELLETLSEELSLQDVLDIIEDYDLYNVFIDEMKGASEQLELF